MRALVDTVERRADEETGPEAEAEGAAAAALSMRRWRLEAAAAFDFFAADGVAKLPSGTSSGAFMPFVFGGVHVQKGNCSAREKELER